MKAQHYKTSALVYKCRGIVPWGRNRLGSISLCGDCYFYKYIPGP